MSARNTHKKNIYIRVSSRLGVTLRFDLGEIYAQQWRNGLDIFFCTKSTAFTPPFGAGLSAVQSLTLT